MLIASLYTGESLTAADAFVYGSTEDVYCNLEEHLLYMSAQVKNNVAVAQSVMQVLNQNCISISICRWRFCVHMLGKHVVAVALGPPEDVVDAWGVLHYP